MSWGTKLKWREVDRTPPSRCWCFPQRPDKPWQISNAELVGNYAMSFTWADGHDAGIYTWTFLRGLCPCEQCDAEAAGMQDVYSA